MLAAPGRPDSTPRAASSSHLWTATWSWRRHGWSRRCGCSRRMLPWRRSGVRRRYAVGFVSGRSRVPRTRRLLALPFVLFVPTFTALKMAQIFRRTGADLRHLGMFLVVSPLIVWMLARRASLIHALRT